MDSMNAKDSSTSYRNYENADPRVRETYRQMRTNQTYEFAGNRIRDYEEREKVEMKIWDAMNKLDSFVDTSDPDIGIPNLYHLFQTAEGMRKDSKPEWMQVTGLIHDLGKIMYLWGNDQIGTSILAQWAVVGDTFITGCKFPDTLVHSEFNHLNPDMSDERYNTKYGVYEPNTGLENCRCSWGHDEYLYRVLKNNKHNLPPEALYVIRFHSLYPWHDKGEYSHLMNENDARMLPIVRDFNKYDLYTKVDISPDRLQEYYESVRPYYEGLITKYLGDTLWF